MIAAVMPPLTPVVILARPQMGENIGAAARAMMNCGLVDLRLVNPRDGWPNPAALPMAAGGREIIEKTTIFESLAEAAHDVSFMVAASARRRDLPIKSADPRAAANMLLGYHGTVSKTPPISAKVVQAGLRTAMLFGPEASGLDNDEVVLADVLVTVPLNPKYPSLNLAQAVLLMAWEWRMAMHLKNQPDLIEEKAPFPKIVMPVGQLASVQEREFFFNRLENALDESGFFTAPDMATAVKRNLRAFFTRAMPSAQEISTLHGIVQTLTRRRKLNRQNYLTNVKKTHIFLSNSWERGLRQRGVMPVKAVALANVEALPGQQ